jgi:RNA polymerase sigma-70 factor (ECF subfamily)
VPSPEPDDALVTAAKAGSSTAFSELFERYSRRIYRRAFSITRNREDAEDAVQDTFLRAYASLHQFEGRAGFSSWLTRIAINSALMQLRKRRRRQELPFEAATDAGEGYAVLDVKDTRPCPEQMHALKQEYQWVVKSIRRLPTILRTVAELRMLDECSAEEITQQLGISESAIKARLFRARTRMAASRRFLSVQ